MHGLATCPPGVSTFAASSACMIAGEDVLGRSWPNLLLGADGLIACMLDASTEFEDDDDPQRWCWTLPPVRSMVKVSWLKKQASQTRMLLAPPRSPFGGSRIFCTRHQNDR